VDDARHAGAASCREIRPGEAGEELWFDFEDAPGRVGFIQFQLIARLPGRA
jgi:hypothetical protein